MADDPASHAADTDGVFNFSTQPVHLGLGASAIVQPAHTGGAEWYLGYGTRHGSDGNEGRLVSMHTFTEPWDTWEVHPNGDELVACISGEMTLHQEKDGETATVTLQAGEAIVNRPGVWHTADVEGEATAMFITAGSGTDVRPR